MSRPAYPDSQPLWKVFKRLMMVRVATMSGPMPVVMPMSAPKRSKPEVQAWRCHRYHRRTICAGCYVIIRLRSDVSIRDWSLVINRRRLVIGRRLANHHSRQRNADANANAHTRLRSRHSSEYHYTNQ
jgi:hypothetical protein